MKVKLKSVLVTDSGGRGAALVSKYLESSHVGLVLATPGNDLMAENSKKGVKIFPEIKTTDIKGIISVCKLFKVDLVDVSQDDALAVGLVDALTMEGFRVFGPTKAASQIEWDKAWARNFMRKFKISSPLFKVCKNQNEGTDFIKRQKDGQWFVKAAGLAAGKGALFAKDRKEAIKKIQEMKSFGKAGKVFVIEKCLIGEEFSAFALVDGKKFQLLGYAQDHKRVYNNDLGPNTGGMGCSSPPLVVSKKIEIQTKAIIKKTVESLMKIGRTYRGIIYLGAMVDKKGKVFVIEFNARWGDPEAQVIIPSIKNDFYDLATKVLSGKLNKIRIKTDKKYKIVVTAASRGYPSDYSKVVGKKISGLNKVKGVKIFGAGIKKEKNVFVASGGRLFYVMAEGKDVAEARTKAYNALSKISVEGNNLHYRTDIGYRDLERLKIGTRYKT